MVEDEQICRRARMPMLLFVPMLIVGCEVGFHENPSV